MVVIDFVFLGIFVLGMILGFCQGVLKQLFSLVSCAVVIMGTSYLFVFPDMWLVSVIPNGTVRVIVAVVATMVILSSVCCLVSFLLRKAFRSVPFFKGLDIVLGGIMGLVMAYLVIAVFVGLLTNTSAGILVSIKKALQSQMDGSWIVANVYKNNFFGNWIADVVQNALSTYFSAT